MNSVYQKTIEFLPSRDDPLYLPGVPADAVNDPVRVVVDPALAGDHGIELDAQGFPVLDSLDAWHRENNPHLFR